MPRPLAWSRGRHAPGFVALALLGVCLVADFRLLRVGLDELDEGYFADQAARVLHSQVPYRDFESLYTPGLLYVHAWLFDILGGPSLVGMRLASLLARAGMAVGLYVLGRRLLTPPWAALPPLFVLVGLDTIPAGWEPHPGWYSSLCCVVAVGLLARLPSATTRWPWLLGAGAATALTFLFKQNTGAFLALANLDFLILQGADVCPGKPTPALRLLQIVAAAGTLALVGWLMHPYVDAVVAVLIAGPLLATGIVMMRRSNCGPTVGVADRVRLLIPLLIGFAGLTLPWLVVLGVSLGGHLELLRGFIGAVDQTALYSPLELPTADALRGLAVALLLVLGLAPRTGWRWRLTLVSGILSLAAVAVSSTRLPDEPVPASVMLMPERVGFGIAVLLPAIAGAAGAWLCRHNPTTESDWCLRWYLLAAALAVLTQYPRMDTIHLAWSAPLLLVVGAIAVARAHKALSRRWQLMTVGRAVLVTAMLLVPFLAALPAVYLRAGTLFQADADTGWPQRAWVVPLERPSVVQGFQVSAPLNWQLTDLLDYLRANTRAGEPVFMYPSEPLLYVLADRPNPTRLSHIYPGIGDGDVQILLHDLEIARVSTVVVSDAWLSFWDWGSATEPIDAYFATHFEEVARFGVYRVLERRTGLDASPRRQF